MNNDFHDIAIDLGNSIDRLVRLSNSLENRDGLRAEIKTLAKTRDDMCRILNKNVEHADKVKRRRNLGDKLDAMIDEAHDAGLDDLAVAIGQIQWGDIKGFADAHPAPGHPETVMPIDAVGFVASMLDGSIVDLIGTKTAARWTRNF